MTTIARALCVYDRAWPDDGHLPPENVDQLRQLINARLAIKSAEPGYPRIVAKLMVPFPFSTGIRIACQQGIQLVLRVHDHGSKLQTSE